MARQKAFDRHVALERAMAAFRPKGYAATSMVTHELFEAFEAPGSGIEAIRQFFRLRVKGALDRSRPPGCLVTNSAVELSGRDRRAAAKVGGSLARIEAAFLRALERARAAGELPVSCDLPALARFLTSSAQGLSVMARTARDRAVLGDVVDIVLSVLDSRRPGAGGCEHRRGKGEGKETS